MWEENKHPRDKSGQFTSKGNEGQGGAKPKLEAQPNRQEPIITKKEEIEDDFDNDFEEEFIENIDNIDYDKAEENEKKNADKGRKSDGSLSDEAFKIGQKGAKTYLDFMTQYNDLDKLKGSNIFLGGLQSAVSKAITEAGYNPNFELTYKDFNDVVGSVLGEEVDYEEYERNATKGFTGNKYSGYNVKKDNLYEKIKSFNEIKDLKKFAEENLDIILTNDDLRKAYLEKSTKLRNEHNKNVYGK